MFGPIDVPVDYGELVEVLSVVVFPCGSLDDVGRDRLEGSIETLELRLVPRDLVVEPGDAVLELASLVAVCASADGTKTVELFLGDVLSPPCSVEVVLFGLMLPGELAELSTPIRRTGTHPTLHDVGVRAGAGRAS